MHYKFKTKPFEHQQKALDMSWEKENFAYLWKWEQANLRY